MQKGLAYLYDVSDEWLDHEELSGGSFRASIPLHPYDDSGVSFQAALAQVVQVVDHVVIGLKSKISEVEL